MRAAIKGRVENRVTPMGLKVRAISVKILIGEAIAGAGRGRGAGGPTRSVKSGARERAHLAQGLIICCLPSSMLVNFHVNVCDDCGKNKVDKAFSHHRQRDKGERHSVNTYITNNASRVRRGLIRVNNFSS